MSIDTSDDQVAPSPDAEPEKLTMGIDPWERNWMRFSIALLVVFAAAVTIAGFAAGFQLPGRESRVDPRTVLDEGPWSEPGLYEIGPGEYEAYIIAQTWSFAPRELVVPVGSEVTMYVTSPDLQHGLKILDTNVNMMVVPGEVSRLRFTFDEVGDFPVLCTEYCGKGHAAMFGNVKVLSEADFAAETETDAEADAETAEGPSTDTEDTESTESTP